MEESLVEILRLISARFLSLSTRKSVQEGQSDRIANLLEEAADEIEYLIEELDYKEQEISGLINELKSCEWIQSTSD